MKRFTDKPYSSYSVYSEAKKGLCVTCPKCGSQAAVIIDYTSAFCKCGHCGYAKTKELVSYRCSVENQCEKCGHFYRVQISDSRLIRFPVQSVTCPRCGHKMPGKIQKTPACIYTDEIRDGCEPFFGLRLWFFTHYDGKPLWALNRGHLAYLIDYLDAGLREEPSTYSGTMRTASDRLPAFLKTAKNRAGIVKRLKQMLEM